MSELTSPMSDEGTETAQGAPEPGLVLVYATDTAAPLPAVFRLQRSATLLGREPPKGGLTIAQAAVSRVHATLTKSGDGSVRIRDMSSRNGTFVNGEKTSGDWALEDGDIVRVGDALFRFVESGAAEHEADAAAPRRLPAAGIGGASMVRLERSLLSLAKGDASVLLSGETGVGKELLARAVHEASGRPGPFVAVNCAALPGTLVESLLFGHERGAFTGADRAGPGLVRSAEGGTILLDEVGDMPADAQAKLLRVLESREVLPVGGTRPVPVDVRVISATHEDLPALVTGGRFRADLYARIAQRTVVVPPLRDRKEDLFALATAFAGGTSTEPAAVTIGFMQRLALYDWPFNVRELKSAVQHAVEAAGGGPLHASHLPDHVRAPQPPEEPPATGPAARRKGPTADELREVLTKAGGNVALAARTLGRDAAQIYRWIKQYGLRPDDFR